MKRKLNVLMLTHKTRISSWPRSHALAAQLVKTGHQVTLILISENEKQQLRTSVWDGIHVVESPDIFVGRLRSGWDPWDTLSRVKWIDRTQEHFDLIHCFETRPVSIYPALRLQKRDQIPIITDWNDWWGRHGLIDVNRPTWYPFLAGWLETYYEEAFRKDAAGLTVIASGLADRAIAMGISPERICLLPGGASTETYRMMDMQTSRQHFQIDSSAPVLGFCSADSYLDIELIFDALQILVGKYPNIKLIMTGKVKPEVRQMIRKRNLEHHLLLPGFLSNEEYPVYLSCANVFLLPLANKPYNLGRWPNKMGDYLSLGRPTVSNPVGDIKTLFEKYPVGLLAAWDAQDFAGKISTLLDQPDVSRIYGEKARWVAENIYNWETLGRRLEEFYCQILDGGSLKINVSEVKQ